MSGLLLKVKYNDPNQMSADTCLGQIMIATFLHDLHKLVNSIIFLRQLDSLHLLNTQPKGIYASDYTPLQAALVPFAQSKGFEPEISSGDLMILERAHAVVIKVLLLAGSDPKVATPFVRARAEPGDRALVDEFEKNEGCKWDLERVLLCCPPCDTLLHIIQDGGLAIGAPINIKEHLKECRCSGYFLQLDGKGSAARCEYSQCKGILMLHQNMVCGGCQETKYCSRRCSKLDWKRHKAVCKSRASGISRIEVEALVQPKLSTTATFLYKFVDTIIGDPPLDLAISTALRLGTPDSLRTTHGFVVVFEFNLGPGPAPIWQRARITHCYTRALDEMRIEPAHLEKIRNPECTAAFVNFCARRKGEPQREKRDLRLSTIFEPKSSCFLGWDPIGKVRREQSWQQDLREDYARWTRAVHDTDHTTEYWRNNGWERVWGAGREERSIIFAPIPSHKGVGSYIASQTIEGKTKNTTMVFLESTPSAKDLRSGKSLV